MITYKRDDEAQTHQLSGSQVDLAPGAYIFTSKAPGFTDRTVREVLDARARGEPIRTFHTLTAWLDPETPDASAKLPGLILLTTPGWVVTVRTRTGTPPVTAVIEARLSRAGHGTIVTGRRSWLE